MRDYDRENISRARELRKNMTPWERKLWYEFLRSYPVRFQRQKAIGHYIVDFSVLKPVLRWNWTVVDIIHRSKPRKTSFVHAY